MRIILLAILSILFSCASIKKKNYDRSLTNNKYNGDVNSLDTIIHNYVFSTDSALAQKYDFKRMQLTMDSLKPVIFTDSSWFINQSEEKMDQSVVLMKGFYAINKYESEYNYFENEVFFYRLDNQKELFYTTDASTNTFHIPWGLHTCSDALDFLDTLKLKDEFESLSTIQITDSTQFIHLGNYFMPNARQAEQKMRRENGQSVKDLYENEFLLIMAITPTGSSSYNWCGLHLTTYYEYQEQSKYYGQFEPLIISGKLDLTK